VSERIHWPLSRDKRGPFACRFAERDNKKAIRKRSNPFMYQPSANEHPIPLADKPNSGKSFIRIPRAILVNQIA
jgi:hypothetical protein